MAAALMATQDEGHRQTRLFLTGQTLEELQAKFRTPSPALAPLWRHFLLLARGVQSVVTR